MMNMMWFVRAARWARNPPSPKRVKLVFTVIAIAVAIAALGHYGFWPDWAVLERNSMRLPAVKPLN